MSARSSQMMLQWGHDLLIVECAHAFGSRYAVATASMGPRSVDRGMRGLPEVNLPVRHTLQWGHDLLIVEARPSDNTSGRASPLQWGHDLLIVEGRGAA